MITGDITDMGSWEDEDIQWERRQEDRCDNDIEVETEVTVAYDMGEEEFWEHAGAWGNSVIGGLAPAYNLIAVSSTLRSTRAPLRPSHAGVSEFEDMARSLSGIPSAFMTLSGFAKTDHRRFPFDVSFSYPEARVMSYDVSAKEWLVKTLSMTTEQLWHTMYVSEEEYEHLSRLLAEDGSDAATGRDGR